MPTESEREALVKDALPDDVDALKDMVYKLAFRESAEPEHVPDQVIRQKTITARNYDNYPSCFRPRGCSST